MRSGRAHDGLMRGNAAAMGSLAFAVLLCACLMAGCSGAGHDANTGQDAAVPEQEAAAPGEPDRDTLYDVLEQEDADALIALAATDENAAWIAANASAYDVFDPAVEAKVLELAADEPLAAAYVRDFPERYPTDPEWFEPTEPDYDAPALPAGSPSPDVPDTAIPHLYQWDARWGYTTYNGDAFGLSGCGPTSLAMVYQGLTGKTDLSPFDLAIKAYAGNYVVPYSGTASNYFEEMAEQLGLRYDEIPVTAESIVSVLSEGRPIVANVGPGTFTTYGHYFVLAGVTDDGRVILNDPYSASRSSQLWDPALIASESYKLYAYSLA